MTDIAYVKRRGEDVPALVAGVLAALGFSGLTAAIELELRAAAPADFEPGTAAAPVPDRAAPSLMAAGSLPGLGSPSLDAEPAPRPDAALASEGASSPAKTPALPAASPPEAPSPGARCPAPQRYTFARGATRPYEPVEADELQSWLAEHPDATVVVDGHSDAVGSEVQNLQISRRRARAVARELVQRGVDPGRIRVRAFGEYVPPVDADGPDGSRRVQVHVVGAAPCGGGRP